MVADIPKCQSQQRSAAILTDMEET